ncbi:carboxypeptidase M32 [Lichenibacterium dinghuense]|uniref:carboxypeptidase M32 n=1 Tax=Lichenibacterium dinghuense TaxID=2895977 RepID=UPI001F27216B|nr:carboxypeptidase M32 [Lichenibacterium sp. 6Y81]
MAGTERFDALMGRINDVLCAVNLLAWDARTGMPPAGAAARGRQSATLLGIARDLATGDDMRAALDEARAAVPEADPRRTLIEGAEAAVASLRRLPARLVEAAAELRGPAQAAWAACRAADDFATFRPFLERTVAIRREWAEALGYEAHPYDALVGLHEPGMTLARLAPLYAALEAGIRPLLRRALAGAGPEPAWLARRYPVAEQRAFALEMAGRFGYDLARGRLDDTVHPFEVSMGRDDVRITGRFREDWLPGGLFAVWHEAGHGLYEQSVDPALSRTVAATDLRNLNALAGASLGLHESQSRLLENRVGRSAAFWDLHFDEFASRFPDQLADADAEGFWRAVNRARPSLIRVEADELTYDAHIMLRTDIEARLIAGELAVRDVPGAWAEAMQDRLGLAVPTDREGCLQDVHWSSGGFGTFPTYTLGNVMGAQFFAAASAEPAVAEGLGRGDYAPLARWLAEHLHRHGRSRSPARLLRDATGSDLDPAAYLAALAAKVDRLVREA